MTATGTSRATALALTAAINVVSTVASGAGVNLNNGNPAVITGGVIRVFNDGANPLKVYVQGTNLIDGIAGATGVTLTNGKACDYLLLATDWRSTLLGGTSS